MKILELDNTQDIQKKFVITIGMFDGVHIGHRQLLENLKQQTKLLNQKENTDIYSSLVITFTNHPKSVLNKDSDFHIKLLQTAEERFSKLSETGAEYLLPITFTKELASYSPKKFLDLLKSKLEISTLILGYDNRFGNPKNNEYEELLQTHFYNNTEIKRIDSAVYYNSAEVSSTKIRQAISEGNVSLADNMLAEEYSITSKVTHGLKNGGKIGFPTANIVVPKDKIIPKQGVYLTKTVIDKKQYGSVTNIGNNPTFNAKEITIETYIKNFSQDIYGKEITVKFIDFIREEKKFNSVNELIRQMQEDIKYGG